MCFMVVLVALNGGAQQDRKGALLIKLATNKLQSNECGGYVMCCNDEVIRKNCSPT